jgi:hypothetical protein
LRDQTDKTSVIMTGARDNKPISGIKYSRLNVRGSRIAF